MKSLLKKTKAELIEEIQNLQHRYDNINLYPGSAVINKYEKLLSRSEDKYKTFLKTSAFLSVVISNGKIIEANDKLVKYFNNYQIIGKDFTEFIPINQPDGKNSIIKLKEKVKEVIQAKFMSFLWQLKVNEKLFNFECSFNYLKINGVKYFQIFLKEVDYLKNNELELLKIRNSYNTLINFIPECIIIHKLGIIVSANFETLKLLNYSNFDEIIGLSLFDIIHPDNIEKAKIRLKILSSGLNVPNTEYKILPKGSKNYKYVQVKSFPLLSYGNDEVLMTFHELNDEKRIAGRLERANDIEFANKLLQSEIINRVKTQEQLETTKRFLANIINSSLDVIFATDKEGLFIEFNKSAETTFGYAKSDVLGSSMSILFSNPNDYSNIQSIMSEYKMFSDEVVSIKSDGTTFYTYLNLSEIYDESELLTGRVGVLRDITKLKEQQLVIHNSEKRYSEIFESTSDLMCSFNSDGTFIYVNKSFKSILGYSSSMLSSISFFDLIHPNDLQFFINDIVFNQDVKFDSNVELTLITQKKNYVIVSGNINKQMNDNITNSFICSFKDVSRLKLAENAMKISEDRYKSVFNQDFIGIVITGFFGEILQFNEHFVKLFSLQNQLNSNTNISDILSDKKDFNSLINLLLYSESNKVSGTREFVVLGNKIICNESIELVKDSTGIPNYLIFFYEDITEKKNVEIKVIAQSAKLNALLQSSSQLIFTINHKIQLTSFNEQVKLFLKQELGIEPKLDSELIPFFEHIGMKDIIDDFIYYHQLALSGQPQYFERKFVSTKGYFLWFETYVDPIILPSGDILEVAYISHNITDKKLSIDRISQALKEKDILLKEVHHRVKNNLQVVSSILNLQASFLKDNSTIVIFRDLQDRIQSMSLVHENLYQNTDISDLSLNAYVNQLILNLARSHNLASSNINVVSNVEDVKLGLDFLIPCGLIINELISNCFKHAFGHNDKGEVCIDAYVIDNYCSIMVSDTGKGFKKGFIFEESKSLGLQLVSALVSQINGKIDFNSNKNKTIITFKFNII